MTMIAFRPLSIVLALGAVMAWATPAAAEDVVQLDSGDTAWMLTSTALVLLMTIPGLALFYGGMVRRANVLATMMQSFSICCLVSVLWVVIGFSLAFAPGGDFIGGTGAILLEDLATSGLTGTLPTSVFVAFQMTFAIITPALIAGAFADRIKFSALLWFVGLWLVLVYSPVAHWVWGGGFLGRAGVLDYAGGTVVHLNAGVAGLVAALVLGKRIPFGPLTFKPHNLVLTFVGASFLWVGWFGFNAGSALAADGRAGMALLVTQVAAATAALTWMFGEWWIESRPSVLGAASGAVAGLVAITPASGFVGIDGALAIGVAAGLSCYAGATVLKRRLGYDDSLDCFGIHGIGGLVGALLTGVFAREMIGGVPGAIEGNWAQVGVQAWGVLATLGYTAVASLVILKAIERTIGLRVTAEVERDGLDLALHGETVP